MSISRFLGIVGLSVWLPVNAAPDDKSLRFFHTHTGKSIEVSYFKNGDYDAQALESLNHFLADFRSGEAVDMDRRLFDILYLIQRTTGHGGAYQVISAYRSPQTNEMLRARSNGVAKKSQHLLGNAIDVRLPGVDTGKLRDIAKALGLGGVGFYRKSDFIHVDVGRVRYW
jgi:uncharacterized protein YcbK (DUF882 family)